MLINYINITPSEILWLYTPRKIQTVTLTERKITTYKNNAELNLGVYFLLPSGTKSLTHSYFEEKKQKQKFQSWNYP